MTRYLVLIDGQAGAYGVFVPDMPGCYAMGTTVDEALINITDAMCDWTASMEQLGLPFDAPRSYEALHADPEVITALADGSVFATVPLVRRTGMTVRVNLSIDSGSLAALDAEAARRGINRSAMVTVLVGQYLPRLG